MKKKIEYPIHKMGKNRWYELHEDGSIQVAPKYTDMMDKMRVSELAIKKLLDVVTRQCAELYAITQKEGVEIWSKLQEDYGLDATVRWKYNYETKRIFTEGEAREKQD